MSAALAVFASGSGTNLQSLLETFGADASTDDAAHVALVVSDRSGIGALDRAERAGVPTAVLAPKAFEDRDTFAAALLETLEGHAIEMIALAGYLKLVPEAVVQAFRGRIVNIHPGPLPAFGGPGMYGYGHHVHEAVLESGVRVSGPTIHFVDERYDTGPIIAQWPVPVLADDDPESLAVRVLKHEHRLYPAVVRAVARGDVRLEDDGRVDYAAVGSAEGPGFALVGIDAALESIDSRWRAR